MKCCVLGCSTNNYNDSRIKLHEFPFDNQSSLPLWIMATNRTDWLPTPKSRICDKHFNNDEYKGGDKNNELKQNARPTLNTSSNNIEDKSDESYSEVSSTSDVNTSDIDSNNLLNSAYYNTKNSDEDSILNTSSDSDLNEATGLDDNYLSSISEKSDSECDVENDTEVFEEESIHNPITLSIATFEDADQFINQKCAVVLCNENVRNQFYGLFFINFPNNNKMLRDKWWKICGRNDKFDPSFKICSIHFGANNFKSIDSVQNGKICQKTILKNNTILPSFYLLPHEYIIFTRNQKKRFSVANNTEIKNKSTEMVKCAVQSCKKTFFKDGKRTLFFKFPLESNFLFKTWVNIIKLTNWQPSEIDRICSDHFENYYISNVNNIYELNKYAIPSIKPKNPFVLNSEDNCNRNFKKSVKHHNIEYNSNNLNEKRKDKDEEHSSLDSLENNTEDSQLKKFKKTLITPITPFNSTERNLNKEKYNQVELMLKTNENKSVNVSNTNTINNISLKKCDSNVIHKSQIEFIEQNVTEEEMLIPKSMNNGNDYDYVYLDTLEGDNVEKFVSFEKKCISMNKKQKMELLNENRKSSIPESIYNQDLSSCYGEMLPPYCNSNCLLTCFNSIPGPQRREIHKEFHTSPNVTVQNCNIAQLIKLRMIKKEDDTFESYPVYHLLMNDELVKVCRKFFLNTLGIPKQRLDAILKPNNYSWYSDRETALKANLPKQVNVIDEPIIMTDFMKESLKPLNKDYNLYEPESDPEVSLEDVPFEEYEKVIAYLKSVPRVLSSYQFPGEMRKQYFETSICSEYMYKMYSENYIRNKTPPPYTMRQFKKIYNRYMKTFLKMV